MFMISIFSKSIGVRLFGLFALLGAGTIAVALSASLILSAYERGVHSATNAADSARMAERIDGHVLSVVMDSRGLYLARNQAEARRFSQALLDRLERMKRDIAAWRHLIPETEVAAFTRLQSSAEEFTAFRTELARIAVQDGAEAADRMGNNEANRANRQALNANLTTMAEAAAQRSDRLAAAASAEGAMAIAWLNGITLVVLLCVTTIAVAIVRRSILRPVLAATSALDVMAQGDLTKSVPGGERVDEMGRMAAAAEQLRASLLRARELEQAAAAEVEARMRRGEAMAAATVEFESQLGHALAELGQASSEVEGAAARMRCMASTVAEAATGASTGAQGALDEVQTVAAASEELASSVREIGRQVNQSAVVARRAVTEVRTTDATVGSLSEAAERIGQVVRMIGEIANQTNLLALNATIEAARAGEAGKGFAVVASEVKQLAAQTGKATEEIGAQITSMQEATQAAVAAIHRIGSVVSELENISAAIAAAVEEQGAATSEIARSVTQAAVGTEAVTRRVAELDGTGQGAAQEALSLVRSAETMKNQSSGLRSTVTGFFQRLKEVA
jgi:methyl-accepting chemotaxis protein